MSGYKEIKVGDTTYFLSPHVWDCNKDIHDFLEAGATRKLFSLSAYVVDGNGRFLKQSLDTIELLQMFGSFLYPEKS